jgi:hypothetical protein
MIIRQIVEKRDEFRQRRAEKSHRLENVRASDLTKKRIR